MVAWLTGISGSGKSTLAGLLSARLREGGLQHEWLDGDSVRRELAGGLGFSPEERSLQCRRLAYLAGLLAQHGVTVVVSAISPFRADRRTAREKLERFGFLEVYVNAPLGTCETRDPKGIYALARCGKINNLTGIAGVYEPPDSPEVECRTDMESAEQSLDRIWLAASNLLAPAPGRRRLGRTAMALRY